MTTAKKKTTSNKPTKSKSKSITDNDKSMLQNLTIIEEEIKDVEVVEEDDDEIFAHLALSNLSEIKLSDIEVDYNT